MGRVSIWVCLSQREWVKRWITRRRRRRSVSWNFVILSSIAAVIHAFRIMLICRWGETDWMIRKRSFIPSSTLQLNTGCLTPPHFPKFYIYAFSVALVLTSRHWFAFSWIPDKPPCQCWSPRPRALYYHQHRQLPLSCGETTQTQCKTEATKQQRLPQRPICIISKTNTSYL